MSDFKFRPKMYVSLLEEGYPPQMWRVESSGLIEGRPKYNIRGLTDGREVQVDEDQIYEVLMG